MYVRKQVQISGVKENKMTKGEKEGRKGKKKEKEKEKEKRKKREKGREKENKIAEIR